MRLRVIVAVLALAFGAAGCDWPMFMHDAAHSGRSPDTSVSAANVAGGLTERWRASLGTPDPSGIATSAPVVVNGVLYVGTWEGRVIALDAAGNNGCSGSPVKTCQPLWETGSADAQTTATPAVANGVVYVARPNGILAAYDANDQSSCLGTPLVCSPIWTGATASGGFSGSPVVANNKVYEGAGDGFVYAYDAVTSCTSGCAPRTKYQTGAAIVSSPAVANNVLYTGSTDGKLYAFDANGNTGCSGAPVKTCQPLWTAATGAEIHSSPSVDSGRVFVGSTDWKLYAFDAAGSTGCSGAPKTCAPLWTASTPNNVDSSPAVANNVVYVATTAGGSNPARLNAFDATGNTNCSGSPRTCQPLWWSNMPSMFGMTPVSVANGVVYTVLLTGIFSFTGNVVAFDASAPNTRCSGTPKACAPLWTAAPSDSGVVASAVTVANGFVYAAGGEIHAFSP